jgi:hypothetical protein
MFAPQVRSFYFDALAACHKSAYIVVALVSFQKMALLVEKIVLLSLFEIMTS